MKFLLYCFEWMSGLKINYHKSEVVTFGVDKENEDRIANILNCKVGVLPMRYLGFPISDKRLGVNAFRDIVGKLRHRLQPWKRKHPRLVLTNTSLSSLPVYMMSMFLLHESTHHQMDTIRAKFFWGSDGESYKYHMIKWDNTCLLKYFGGVGIINTITLNEALIVKWIWRLNNVGEGDTCCELLKNKYMKNKPLAACNGKGGSHFWQGVNKVKHKFRWGAKMEVHNGENTIFWSDVWRGEVPLKLVFPKLYEYCRNKNCTVSDCWDGSEWRMDFSRPLSPVEAEGWEDMIAMLREVRLDSFPDKVHWLLEKSGKYTTKCRGRP
jgi:hypothetical protein